MSLELASGSKALVAQFTFEGLVLSMRNIDMIIQTGLGLVVIRTHVTLKVPLAGMPINVSAQSTLVKRNERTMRTS